MTGPSRIATVAPRGGRTDQETRTFDRMLINGELVSSSGCFAVVNPATELPIGTAPDCSEADLDGAIAAARAAFADWAATPIDARRAMLNALADALLSDIDAFTRLLTSEQGKPHADAEQEIAGAVFWLRAVASLDIPVLVNEDTPERYSETTRAPIGVVGAIAPWNFPVILAVFKLAPALLTGNCVVLKPSPFTPLTALRLGALAAEIFPAGVLNVITGGDDLGPRMTAHPGIDKISFTGSTGTGRRVMQAASATLKRLTLELGGNDAAIVLPDVDVEKIAEDLFWAAFRNCGQVCVATKRMYVHRDVYEPLKKALVTYAATVRVGDGSQQGVRIGPINNRPQYERVRDLIDASREQGLTFLTGSEKTPQRGYFIPVTIIDNPPEDSRIVQEEQFGPVLPLIRFENIEDVIERANATEFGLGASVWGANEEQTLAIAQRLASGTVWVNETQHLSPFAPFGGIKQSGMGVEGGVAGLLEYTNARTIVRRRRPLPA